MVEITPASPGLVTLANVTARQVKTKLAVIWIDWYAYHVARLRAIADHPAFAGCAVGIELVGGAGVHAGMVFRSEERQGLAITTLVDNLGWSEASQLDLSRRLWAELDRLKPEAILVPGYYTLPALASVLWARTHGKKAILMSESTKRDHPRKSYIESLKRNVLPRLFHAAISGGKRTTSYLRELGFQDKVIAHRYDVVDNTFFSETSDRCLKEESREHFNLPGNYFVYVGRLAPEKNIDGLIDAFAQYRRLGGSWSLVLVGDGPLKEDLRRQAASAGLREYVHFPGLKNMRELVPYYAFAKCFVLPSWREPWGLVTNEAMCCGLPVILSDCCGCTDDLLVNGWNGYGFDPSQEGTLTKCLLNMDQLDESERRRMSLRSRDIISDYSPRFWAEEVANIVGITPIATSTRG